MSDAPEVAPEDELLSREQRLQELLRRGNDTLAAARATIDLLDAALRGRDDGTVVDLRVDPPSR
jgi:hypothetical protein